MPTADVLIVDDDQAIRRLFTDIMEDEGHGARAACNGLEALKECERQVPDLLLLDLSMPVLDGYEVLRELDVRGLPSFPIIVVTGNAIITSGLSTRIVGTLRKPVDLEELCRAAARALSITKVPQAQQLAG